MGTMENPSVLIVGAGPTGLLLALWLARRGVLFRIVDGKSGPGQASRAMAVQARTLEFYRQLGFADAVVASGVPMDTLHLWEGGHEAAVMPLGDFGRDQSPYPFVLSYPQDDHERLLVAKLAESGVNVEWNTELVSFTQDDAGVRATLRKGGTEETLEAAYLCGCDGAHSAVRHGLDIGFPGGTYDQRFYVADADVTGRSAQDHDIVICMEESGFGLCLPVRSTGMHRLIGAVPSEAGEAPTDFEAIRPTVERIMGLQVRSVNWFSTYQVHHRVADRFRQGRAFLLGDAGHVHSPAGGQGMNTGLGDAVNLAWKLASVLKDGASPGLLDTYEPERIAFARLLVQTTDRVFQTTTGKGALSRLVRTLIAPHLIPFAFRFAGVRRSAFDTVSQIRIEYRHSPLSEGHAGDVHGGDRLPWTGSTGTDNFEPLGSLGWQIHVYGTPTDDLRQAADDLRMPLHAFTWREAMRPHGLLRDGAYLLRPDGYVAVADANGDTDSIRAFVARVLR